MICYNCGRELLDDEIFCVNCGAQMQQMPMQQMPIQQMPMQEIPVQEIPVQKTPVKETHVEEKVIYVEEKTITKEVNMNQTSLWWLTPLALFLMFLIAWIIDIFMFTFSADFFVVAFGVGGLICFSIYEDDDKRRIVRFFRIVSYVAKVSIAICAIIVITYRIPKEKKVLNISNVTENELESDMYVKGTICKVMSKVGEFDGKTYYTVMLPSTDMIDWEALDKTRVEQVIDITNGKIPLTGVRSEERRVLTVATDDAETIKLFDEMVYESEHPIETFISGSKSKYKGIFVVKKLSDNEIISAFEKSAMGQDELTVLGFGIQGVNQGNLSYYELETRSFVSEGMLNSERNESIGILVAIGIYILWKGICKFIGYIRRQSAAKNV